MLICKIKKWLVNREVDESQERVLEMNNEPSTEKLNVSDKGRH